MEMDQRIPDLSDKELERLLANAVRLQESGSDKQRQQAEQLLPLLSAAIEERRAARVLAQAEQRRANARKKSAANETLKANFD
ncbi:MAG: hypothetical protein H7124_07570 [Phycisphaerales bacterium]|nr:hypothetical protein [Hyphomonadaceae bacterium]